MIHYHGSDIHPPSASMEAARAGHCLITWNQVDQTVIGDVLAVCQSFMLDNGAFSAWRQGKTVADWSGYYDWVYRMARCPSFDFAVIPDVIDGDESQNNELLEEWPHSEWIGAPVWHLHESLDRLDRIAHEWPRICLGSSGDYQTPGSKIWWRRIHEAMRVICDDEGIPCCKLHGLRMLNTSLFTKMPLSSADSSNIARNIKLDTNWPGAYAPPTRAARAYVLRQRIEHHNAPLVWTPLCTESYSLF